jgi:hypothetical protein
MPDMAKLELPENEIIATKLIETDSIKDQRRREQGVMGVLFGSSTNQPGNVAGFAIIIACVMVGVLLYAPASADVPRRELLTLFASIVPGALGYYFGSRNGSDSSHN